MKVYNFRCVFGADGIIDERKPFLEELKSKCTYDRVYTKEQKSEIRKIAKGFNIHFEGWKDHKYNEEEPAYETLLIHNQDKDDDFCLEIHFQDRDSIFVVYDSGSYSRDVIFDNYNEFIGFLPKLINDFKPV
jgi:hypothetical protein